MIIAICDDDANDLELLAGFCSRFDPKLPTRRYSSAKALLDTVEKEKPDIVFMDIEMEPPNGFEVAVKLCSEDKPPIIVFTTQTLNYAVRGYGLALRYLPKPISFEMFAPVLKLALERALPEKISVNTDNGTEILTISDITYFEVFRHEVCFHLLKHPDMQLRCTFSSVMKLVSGYAFSQIHKSYCVNLRYLAKVEQNQVVLTTGDSIPIGRSYNKVFREHLKNYLKG